MVLARDKRKRDNAGDVHLGAEDVHVKAELDADGLDVLETLLVVGSTTTDVDADLVVGERRLVLLEGTNDTLESGSDVGEVGDTTTNDEDFALWVRLAASDQVDCTKA